MRGGRHPIARRLTVLARRSQRLWHWLRQRMRDWAFWHSPRPKHCRSGDSSGQTTGTDWSSGTSITSSTLWSLENPPDDSRPAPVPGLSSPGQQESLSQPPTVELEHRSDGGGAGDEETALLEHLRRDERLRAAMGFSDELLQTAFLTCRAVALQLLRRVGQRTDVRPSPLA